MDHIETLETFATISREVLYFGTPVAVVSTVNPDGTTNLSAMSSFWALGDRFVIGLSSVGQTSANLSRTGECVLNLPSAREWEYVERLGHTTGRRDLQDYHVKSGLVHASDKFAASGFRPIASELVAPMRAAQCPIQIETKVLAHHRGHGESGAALHYFEVQRLRVHVNASILNDAHDRIDVDRWSPLFYLFRHYFGRGLRLGVNFRARY